MNHIYDQILWPAVVIPESYISSTLRTASSIHGASIYSAVPCSAACELDGKPVGGKDTALLRKLQESYYKRYLETTKG